MKGVNWLLPCPMCGGDNIRFGSVGRLSNPEGVSADNYTFSMHVDCLSCGLRTGRARGAYSTDMELARRRAYANARIMWNTRGGTHADDQAVNQFAEAMRQKMAASREKGRGGWDNLELCKTQDLCHQLIGHLSKDNAANFIDIANFAMMMHQRGDDPKVLSNIFEGILSCE